MTQKAAIYTRISKDAEGEAAGVARQEADCRALAQRLGLEVVASFSDNDISASTLSTKRRAKYDEMLARARAGEFGTIIAYSNSRLTRRPREYEGLIDLYQTHRVAIRTVVSGDHDLSTADGRAVARTIAAWDAAEAERTSERIKRQKRQRAETGDWHGGAPPYGYEAMNKRLIIKESERANILYAAERVLNGYSLHSVVKAWNDSGITNRKGTHWRQSSVRSILRNRSLLGETKAGVVGWEPILTEDQFNRLDRIFSESSRKVTHSPGVLSTKYAMGGGITLCGVCGKRMTAARHHDYTALVCLSRVNGPDPVHHPKRTRPDGKQVDTNRVTVNHDRLESLVLDSIKARLEKDGWESIAAERDPATDSRIRELEAESEGLLERQRRVNDLFLSDSMDAEQHGAEIQRIKVRREDIAQEVSRLHGMPVVAGLVSDGLDFTNTELWTAERKRALLKGLGVRVYVDPWPEGVSHNPSRKAGESDAERAKRLERHHRDVLIKRVRIEYPSGR